MGEISCLDNGAQRIVQSQPIHSFIHVSGPDISGMVCLKVMDQVIEPVNLSGEHPAAGLVPAIDGQVSVCRLDQHILLMQPRLTDIHSTRARFKGEIPVVPDE